jgi:hypothetical protein
VALAAGPARAQEPVFKYTSLVLYLPEQALEERGPSAEEFSAYVKAVQTTANYILAGAPKQPGISGSLVVAFKPPAQSRVWVVTTEKQRQSALLALLEGPLEAIAAPTVRGYNAIGINFDAWGGAPGPRAPATYPIPDEWRDALKAHGGGILPDAALALVWP